MFRKRLLGLAAQKFMADLATDAYQYSRIRSSTGNMQGQAGIGTTSFAGRSGKGNERSRVTLTLEDLTSALNEQGINVRRPEFYR